MKPIPSPMSRHALDLMNKAQELTQRIDMLEKQKCPKCENTKMGCAKMGCGGKMEKGLEMVEHEGKKVPKFAADGKGAKDMKAKADMAIKDSYCMKNFGKKYSECSAKEKAQCDKAHGKPDKDDKMKGDGVFTIGDAQRRNAGFPVESRQEMDYSDEEGDPTMYDYNEATREQASPMSMREDNTTARTLPLSEGKTREQKRGDSSRGVQVKKPGFRSSEPMPLTDMSASGKPERIEDARMKSLRERGLNTQYAKVRKGVAEGAQPGFITSYDSSPMGVMFMSETGGQTRNAYYTTNQYPYNAEDVANKGATSVEVSLDKLAAMLNPHEGGGVSRLDNNGVLSNNPY